MRRVLITAGARGIGRAMADAFDTAGYDVWVTDLDSSALSDLPEDWTGIGANVADEGHMREVFDRIGTVDVVCANAGIAGPTAAVEDVSLDDWRTCFSVNLEGAFLAAKYAAPLMKKAGAGQ